MQGLIAVTGATGALGGRVATRLAGRGVAQRLVARDPSRLPPATDGADVALASGYDDREAMTAAFRGAQTVFLVSAREAADRVAEHVSAVDAAVAAGVERIVYTSYLGAAPDATFTFGRDHYATEQHIRGTGLEFTFLRDSLYADFAALVVTDGVIAGPAGDGRVSWVARDDIADAAVAVLTGDGHAGQTYDLTGPTARSLADTAALLSELSGREIRYVSETLEQAYASRAAFGAPRFEVDGWVTSYVAIAKGEMELVSDAVEQLTGRPAQDLRDYLVAHPDSWAHLRNDG